MRAIKATAKRTGHKFRLRPRLEQLEGRLLLDGGCGIEHAHSDDFDCAGRAIVMDVHLGGVGGPPVLLEDSQSGGLGTSLPWAGGMVFPGEPFRPAGQEYWRAPQEDRSALLAALATGGPGLNVGECGVTIPDLCGTVIVGEALIIGSHSGGFPDDRIRT